MEKVIKKSIEDSISPYIKSQINDPWKGTCFEGYKYINNKQKGDIGERYVSNYMEEILNSHVEPAESSTAPYDRVFDNYKTEIKFSLAHSNNNSIVPSLKKNKKGEISWSINHVAAEKDWERLIFCGINLIAGEIEPTIVWCDKKDFINCLSDTKYFSRQQGGKTSNNDDYMCAGSSTLKWIQSKYTKDISEW